MGMTKNNSIFYLLILIVIFLYTAQAGIPEDSNIPDLKPSHISIFNDENNTVTALEIPPIILGPGDMEVGMNETASIEWTIVEFDPDTYQVYRDNVRIVDPTSYNNSQRITVQVQTDTTGIFIYMIQATDMSGNNASDEVTVTVTDNNAPVITGPENMEVDLNGTASIEWILTDSNPDTYQVYLDNVIIVDPTSYNNNQRITVQVQTDTPGSFTYMIQATDKSGNEASDEVSVTVIVTDNNAPVITHPGDMDVDLGETVNIEWTITEPDPDTYQVYLGDVIIVDPTLYTNNQKITFEDQTDNVGTFTYMIQATDKSGNEASDKVLVIVKDKIPPVISSPGNMEVEQDSDMVNIIWAITEQNPGMYCVLRNGDVEVPSTEYQCSDNITVPINTSCLGTYNYTISADDISNNIVSDQVNVTIKDTIKPTISTTSYNEIKIGLKENITWVINEKNPDKYRVEENGIEIVSPTAYQSGVDINVSKNSSKLGILQYKIYASDTSGNEASDEVSVAVTDDNAPVITHPDDMKVGQNEKVSIEWTLTEPDPATYQVYRDDVRIKDPTSYISTQEIPVPVNTSEIGNFTYMIQVTDKSGNNASDKVLVIVKDKIPPVISSPENMEVEQDSYKVNITWAITEQNPGMYCVLRNGDVEVPSTEYRCNDSIIVPINTSCLGTYNYTISADDISNNIVSDQVNVIIKDTIKPTISTTSYNEIKIGLKENITWVINEKNPDKYRVEENGIEIVSPTAYQSGVDINVSKNSSKLGILQYRIYASDTSGNTASNQINITVTKEKTIRSTNKGGGGGGGTAGEDYKNIQFARSEREIVSEGDNICYCFDTEGNCNIVMYINFTGLTNAGLIPAKVEMLYDTSSLVNYGPLDEVYKNLNMWLGKKGWANPKNIENATITFKVNKTWIDDNNILISNIIVNRYYEGHWHPLTTSLIDCDDDYCYFISQTQGFSSFAITTKREYIGNPGAEGISDKPKTDEKELSVNLPTDVNESGINTSTDQKQDSPGFSLSSGLLSLLICLASIIYCKKKQFL
jgi:PGF-pre-PGF domain-containing protein